MKGFAAAPLWLLMVVVAGCGTTRERRATEQLVMSDAVDRSISRMDFRPLSGEKVYLDTTYLRHVKSDSFVNAEYVISGLRQQVVAAGCLLQDSLNDADIVIEARLGTLGLDDHRVTYGLPENNALSSAVSLLPNSPNVPAIPEIAFARRDAQEGAAKVAAFAYDRHSREPIWQSGVNFSTASARDTWVFGVGPFQSGTIRKSTKLASSALTLPLTDGSLGLAADVERPAVDYTAEIAFNEGWPVTGNNHMPVKKLPQVPADMEWPGEAIADQTGQLDPSERITEATDAASELK